MKEETAKRKPGSFFITVDYDAESNSIYIAEESSSGFEERAGNQEEILAAIQKYFDMYLRSEQREGCKNEK
ncbi:hypothetical protein [Ructibacterium gallinarum]|uniref:Uncharacterized protein n=1 Tax=Ructibacterium gallinarum TaxID=2779355 RepID=A0A9D5M760_9FIRM|nr:hypothetical protein [Ructibacterium gallinarum]MBE5040789.1 hypothetical protein [Ructibacterium gallinarum]